MKGWRLATSIDRGVTGWQHDIVHGDGRFATVWEMPIAGVPWVCLEEWCAGFCEHVRAASLAVTMARAEDDIKDGAA